MTAPFPPFAWKTLGHSLTGAERRAVSTTVTSLLRFQRTLAGWRAPGPAPDATPFVSLYARGRLCGCYGSGEGKPGERVARAFLRALDDGRFGGVRPGERDEVAAQVSYVRRATLVNPETLADELELGVHGVAVVREGGTGTLLLPQVARDERVGAAELVRRLALKAGLGGEGLAGQAVYRIETESVIVRPAMGAHEKRAADRDAAGQDRVAAAVAWLASLVRGDGSVTFAVNARARTSTSVGVMHHGRSAVVAHALADHGTTSVHAGAARRVRARLLADARAALAGGHVEGWPDDPSQIGGTLALLVRGGVPVQGELLAFVRAKDVTRSPWHCAQVVAVLGDDAPEPLWRACLADLEVHPWAPWTLLAADARGDRGVRERAARGLAGGLRAHPPHRGAGTITEVPEVALTSLAVEALARQPSPFARAAVKRARDFILRTQLVGDRVYAALDPRLASGAFPASVISDWLRCDVTAHAVLALAAGGPSSSPSP